MKFLLNISYSNFCHSTHFTLILSTFLLTLFCLFTIPYVQYRLSSSVNLQNQSQIEQLNSTISRLQQCRKFDHFIWQNFVSLPLALVIVFICACLHKRKTFCLQFCNGRPSIPLSFNAFDKRQRHIIAAIFGISANEVLKILEDLLNRMNRKYVVDEEGILTELLKRIGVVLIIGLRYLPLLVR